MKLIKYLLFLVLINSNLFSMKRTLEESLEDISSKFAKLEINNEQKKSDLSGLPLNVWQEVSKWLINKNGKTEEEIFKDFESLKATNKNIREASLKYIETIGLSKNKPNYTYAQFKVDLMDQLLNEKTKEFQEDLENNLNLKIAANQINKQKADKILEENKKLGNLAQAIKYKAVNWIKAHKNDPIFLKNIKDFIDLVSQIASRANRMGDTYKIIFNEKIQVQNKLPKYNINFPDTVKLLILSGFDPNMQSDSYMKNSFLHLAALLGDEEIVKFLLDNKANIEIKNLFKDRPLHYAVKSDNYNIVKLFLDHGVKPNPRNVQDQTPLNFVKNFKILELLENAIMES